MEKVVIIGGGIAGLSAAWTLRDAGVDSVIIEKNEDFGGRCRSFDWNGINLFRGAVAFITAEDNIVEQARKLGIYDTLDLMDMSDEHHHYVLHKDKGVICFNDFTIKDALASSVIPLKEKAALGLAIPKLVSALASCDPRDPTSAAALDDVNACAYFRRYSPAFVDYFLEPCLSLFCGYGEEDYSLAWLMWLMASRLTWANGWWAFKDRGVGQLTKSMEENFAADPRVELRGSTRVTRLSRGPDGVSVVVEGLDGREESIRGDAAIIALPGNAVLDVAPDLDDARTGFLRSIEYSGHHIAYYLLEGSADNLPPRYLLPTADGYETCCIINCRDLGDGRTLAFSQWKNKRCEETRTWTHDQILDDGWGEFVRAIPQLADARIIDRYLQPQYSAITKRPAGYLTRLKAFKELPPVDRLAFAGDYLVNSTVGQAHWSGMTAAQDLLARYRPGHLG